MRIEFIYFTKMEVSSLDGLRNGVCLLGIMNNPVAPEAERPRCTYYRFTKPSNLHKNI